MQEKSTATVAQSERNANIWKAHVKACENSGLSRAAYCRQQNLSYDAFIYWKNKLQSGAPKKSPAINFVPVPVVNTIDKNSLGKGRCSRTACLTVDIDGDYTIGVHDGFSPDTLTQLITTLRSC